ncbi:MAG TPA: SDR family oxidoreductase [Streptosporangiaceae bacterium]|nr:SDR family oxidoreductase [Streptosporangiaceae bacterium]
MPVAEAPQGLSLSREETGGLSLTGRRAVVTGGTRGLGHAIARKLCASGCDVVINYAHDDESAGQACRNLAGLPGTVRAVKADVCDPTALARLVEDSHPAGSGLDIYVHNVAVFCPAATLAASAEGVLREFSAAVLPLLGAAPLLATRLRPGRGRVVAVSSNGAHRVVPRYVGLGAAKAALESTVRYLAVELAPRAITVNAVATAKLAKHPVGGSDPASADGNGDARAVPGDADDRAAAAVAARTPAGRLTRPDDVADVVALLCTDEARWVHGQVITADGGFSLPA